MSILSKPYFHNEAAAFEHVETVLWPQGPVCPHCGSVKKPYRLVGVRSKASKKNPEGIERHGLCKCSDCRGQFTVRMGTIFEESHIPLHKWLQALHLMCSSKKGISAHQMHRTLELTYKTAWFLCHRIRFAMQATAAEPMGGAGKIVEVDETFYGKFDDIPHRQKRRETKNVVLTLVERGGQARSFHVAGHRRSDVEGVMMENIKPETNLMTDEALHYRAVGRKFESHEYVSHKHEEYARGIVSTNTVEGFYSIFKRGMKGVYQHCSEKHLHRYLAEFDFRYSNRVATGVNDEARSNKALVKVIGKRLTYQQSN
ncbi:MAG: IS1595 family transposase [Aestuariivirga sp.]